MRLLAGETGFIPYEMSELLYDEFEVLVSMYTISRALRSHGWSKKVARRIA